LEDSRKTGSSWQKIGNERLWEEGNNWRLFIHQPEGGGVGGGGEGGRGEEEGGGGDI
jgi:hypothetical protein